LLPLVCWRIGKTRLAFRTSSLFTLSYSRFQLQKDALEVIRERLPHISASWRTRLSEQFLEIAQFCMKIISSGLKPSLLITPIGVLQELVSSAVSEEHSALSGIIPILLELIKKIVNEDAVIEQSMSLLEKLTYACLSRSRFYA
jgi:hypothetical protein